MARHSQGGFRDAIGTLEKLITYGEGTIMPADVLEALGVTGSDLLFEVTDLCIERQTAAALQFVQRLANEGVDYPQFIRDLLRHLRQLFLLQHLEEAADDEATLRVLGQTVELDDQQMRRLLPQANQLAPRELVGMIERLGEAQREIRDGLDARLQLELALVRITRPHVDASHAALEERLRRLEAGLGQTRTACETAGAKADAASVAAGAAGAGETTGGSTARQTPAARVAVPPDGAAREDHGAAPTAAAGQSPAAGGEPTPAQPAAELTLDRVKRAWELVLQRVQVSSVPLYALLRDARPTALEEGRLTVALPSGFALGRAREAGNDRLLGAAVAETLGQELAPEFVLAEGQDASPEPEAARPAAPTLDFTQTINLAKQVLDAEEMDQTP